MIPFPLRSQLRPRLGKSTVLSALFVTVLIALCLISTSRASAQSFNCLNASTPTEQVICNYPYLGDLDEEMASRYFTLRNAVGSRTRNILQADQRNWLKQRNGCGYDYRCVESAYLNRIWELWNIY
jgi:uncharacterized protein